MSLTPTQLQELQTIVLDLGEEFPHNADFLWNAAIRIQKADLGPVTGSGGVPAFEAAVADIKLCQEEVQNYQQRQGSPASGFDVAVLQSVPIGTPPPLGLQGEIQYIETAPNIWAATDQILITPAGPNSVQMDEVGTTVFRTVPAASGGIEINNLATGAGFERVLTTSDTPSGTLPAVTTDNALLVADLAGNDWDEAPGIQYDAAAQSLQLNLSAANIAINLIPTHSTNYIALRMSDQATSWFQFRHDYSLSSANHEFLLESSAGGTIWEIENEGNIHLGGTEGASAFKIITTVGNGRVQVTDGATLYLDDVAAAQADLGAHGQLWVNSADGSLNYKYNGAGNIDLTASGGGGGGAGGSASWIYDNTIAGPADPGANEFRTSTGNPVSVTGFYFNDADANGLDIQNLIDTAFAGSQLVMRNANDNTQVRVYTITAIVNNVGWYQVSVDYLFGNGDASIPNGTEILFEFYNSANLGGGTDVANRNDIPYWEGSTNRWQAAGSLININPLTPPLGGRLQLGTTSGYSTTSPQIMRPLGAADTVMDFVYGTDPNNGFLQGYQRVAGEMSFGARIASTNTDMLTLDLLANVRIQAAASFKIEEQGAAAANLAGHGQLWVNSADDSLNYQTEAGVNFVLTAVPSIALNDLSDVDTSGVATGDLLFKSAGDWLDTAGRLYWTDPILTIEGNGTEATLRFDSSGAANNMSTSYQVAGDTKLRVFFNQTTRNLIWEDRDTVNADRMILDIDTGNLTVTGTCDADDFNGVVLTTAGAATNYLDETGAYSVPAGSGAQISGSPLNNQIAVWTGGTDIEGDADLTYDGTNLTLANGGLRADLNPTNLGLFMTNSGAGTEIFALSADNTGGIDFDFTNVTDVNFNGGSIYDFSNEIIRSVSGLYLQERAASQGDIANQGQLWVSSDNSNRLRFTNGDGDDYVVAISGGAVGDNVTVNASFNFNTAGNFADNWIGHYFDGGNNTITLEDSTSTTEWPLYTTITIIAPGSGNQTVVEGAGTTLFDDAGNDTVGGVVVSQGIVSITRQTTTNYIVWGSGWT
jgi:hypothetical protein